MIKAIYLLALLILPLAIKAQTGWITTKVDQNLSVKFPSAPERQEKSNTISYILRSADSIIYSAGVVDYQKVLHLDSAALAPLKDTQNFADGMRNSFVAKKPNYTFGPMTLGKWKSYTTYSISGTDSVHKYAVRILQLLMGNNLYIMSCRIPEGMVTQDNEAFLSSVTLLK